MRARRFEERTEGRGDGFERALVRLAPSGLEQRVHLRKGLTLCIDTLVYIYRERERERERERVVAAFQSTIWERRVSFSKPLS